MPLGRRGRSFVMQGLLPLSTARPCTTCLSAPHLCRTRTPPRSAFSPARIRRAPRGSTLTPTDWSPSCCRDLPSAGKQTCISASANGSIGSKYPHKRLAVDFAGGKHGQVVLGDKANDRRDLEGR